MCVFPRSHGDNASTRHLHTHLLSHTLSCTSSNEQQQRTIHVHAQCNICFNELVICTNKSGNPTETVNQYVMHNESNIMNSKHSRQRQPLLINLRRSCVSSAFRIRQYSSNAIDIFIFIFIFRILRFLFGEMSIKICCSSQILFLYHAAQFCRTGTQKKRQEERSILAPQSISTSVPGGMYWQQQ